MTIVVAVKSGNYLQPRGRRLQFEPGIVAAGDTRLSYLRGSRPPEDDHAKVDSVGDFAVAGYAGNRAIATSVLSKLEEAVIREGDFDPDSIAALAQRMLLEEHRRTRRSQPVAQRVQILLGIRDPKTKSFVLYEMSTDHASTPEPRDGMASIGSHGHYVRNMFETIRDVAARLPADPFRGPQVTLKGNLAPFVWLLLDKAIETAAEAEGRRSFVGGRPHLAVLHSRGVEAMYPDDNILLRL